MGTVKTTDGKQVEKILDVEYSDVMRKSYMDYAMSVIVARAIPDVRDGLKPVQRRTIYDMSELGASSGKPYRKSARISGDTMGKYHPHGDSSIYDALVVMSQGFKKGKTLVDGHGNFGSIEGDGAAASRYTEARLEKFTEQVFLGDLENGVVDYVPNYDETEKEPVVLPCLLPNFLINGSEGIAVGMTTSVPPHNISEVIDLAVYSLDHPDACCAELLNILHGPDFPTGGMVANKKDLLSVYETGIGKLRIRGRVVREHSGAKDRLVVTEIPYTMIGDGISKFLQSVADLVENRVLADISDITNQTSSDGIRIVLELKKGADVGYIEDVLYKKTRLEDTFGVNMLAVHDGRPEVMGLPAVMKAYCDFQYEIYTRKFMSLMEKAKHRIEVLQGLVKAVDIVDLIVAVLRGSKNIKQAKACMVSGSTDGITLKTKVLEKKATGMRFTEVQADAVLAMPLSRLVGLELDALEKELEEKEKMCEKYKRCLENQSEMKKEIKKNLVILKKQFGTERKTEILDLAPVEIREKEEEETEVAVLVDKFYYVHAVDAGVYEKNTEAISTEYRYVVLTTSKAKIAVFCDSGKAHIVKVSDLPFGKLKDKGQPLDNICNYNSQKETAVGFVSTKPAGNMQIFVSSDGLVKAVELSEFDVTRKTIDATKLKDGKFLCVQPYTENGQIVLSTKNGMNIRFRQSEIPQQKRNAAGVVGIRLNDGDEVVYAKAVRSDKELVQPKGMEIEASKIKMMKRGGKGTKTKALQD